MSDRLPRAVTLRDVAERCGVSVSTVSAVVNGAEWVSEPTRARVQEAIEAMGYLPNPLARSLKTQRGYAVGVIASDLTNPFFTEVVRSLSHALREEEHALFLCDSDHQFALGEANLRRLLQGHVAALVIIGDTVSEDALLEVVEQHRTTPVITIEGGYRTDRVSSLVVDSRHGAYLATRHLVERGYRRIGMIGGPSQGPGSTTHAVVQRRDGYLQALREAGHSPDDALLAEGNFRLESGRDAMRELLRRPTRPDAVFAANDMMALGALKAVHEAGLRVPDDVAVIGFDDIPMASLTTPGLSTIKMPTRELGSAAAQLLEEQLLQPGRHRPVQRTFGVELLVRGSSAGE